MKEGNRQREQKFLLQKIKIFRLEGANRCER